MTDFAALVAKPLEETLEKIRYERWPYAAVHIMNWLRDEAQKKPVPDLADRMKKMQAEVENMCEKMRFKYEGGKLVVKVDGLAEQTFKKLRLGTDWFEPDTDVMVQIMAGLDKEIGS